MSEALHINPESFEDEQEHDSEIMESAVGGLSRFVSKQDDGTDDGSGYEGDGYNDDYDEEDDCGDDYYYSEYEEQHYGGERTCWRGSPPKCLDMSPAKQGVVWGLLWIRYIMFDGAI